MCDALIQAMFNSADKTFWSATKSALDRRFTRQLRPAIRHSCDLLSHKDPIFFPEFIDQILENWGHSINLNDDASRTELQVAVALAVLVGERDWPPPSDHLDRIMELVWRYSAGQAPKDIVLAYMLGWERTSVNWSAQDWNGILPGARVCLKHYIRASVDHCLLLLEQGGVLKISRGVSIRQTDFSEMIAQNVSNQMVSSRGVCQCWCQAKRKPNRESAERKCARSHNIGAWNPADCALWAFLQRAVKGFSGDARGFASLAMLPPGLFWFLWNSESRKNPEVPALRQAKEAKLEDGSWTIRKGHIFVEGCLVAKRWWKCPDCNIIFEARHCVDAVSCIRAEVSGQPHDCCPKCRKHRPKGRGKRPKTAYVRECSPVHDVTECQRLAGLLEDAAAHAQLSEWGRVVVHKVNRMLWNGEVNRARSWISPNGEFLWRDLYNQDLAACSDRPASVEELEAAYRRDLVPFFLKVLGG